METDLTLESKSRKIIIDAKYYRSPLGGSRFDADKLVSANLYQLYSYLLNQSHRDERSRVATGMLLYPQIDAPLRLDYRFGEHLLLRIGEIFIKISLNSFKKGWLCDYF
jgi:5-methylcytosine-specific restriction enzyme subunit McrC